MKTSSYGENTPYTPLLKTKCLERDNEIKGALSVDASNYGKPYIFLDRNSKKLGKYVL